MKLFPKHSQCPYCNTIYRYGDLNKLKYKKTGECYHCKRKFGVSRKSLIILLIELILVYTAINAFAIMMIKSLSFVLLFIINLIPTIAALLLLPMYLCLVKSEKDEKKRVE